MSDLQNSIPILEKRKLQAEVAKSIFDEMKTEFGDEKARKILKNAIIKNAIEEGAKLLSRHWVIEDSNGKVQDVKGEGVVGEQPYINPGDQYQYTSGTVIETSLGTMKGSYQMIDDTDNYFEAEIPEFVLSVPRVIH